MSKVKDAYWDLTERYIPQLEEEILKIKTLSKNEKEIINLLFDNLFNNIEDECSTNLKTDLIPQINSIIQESDNVSQRKKDQIADLCRQMPFIDWQPGEKIRVVNGHIYAKIEPTEWLSEALLDEYYKDRLPQERADYEFNKYLKNHPKKAKNMTEKQRDAIYNKIYNKCKREWDKNNPELAKETVVEATYADEPQIELYDDDSEDNVFQYKMDFSGGNDDVKIVADKPSKQPQNNEVDEVNESMVINEEKLPVLNFNRQYMNNTKLSRILATKQIDISDDSFDLKIKERVVNLVNIATDANITLSNKNITQYDISVMDAAYTIMYQGYGYITPEWLIKVMSGNKNQKITPGKINEVIKSIDKLKVIRIKVDCTSEYNAYRDKKGQAPVDYWGYESYLLPLGEIEARYEANGKLVRAYTVLEKPALYRYAEMNGQIVDVPAFLLETQDKFSDTDEAVLVKRYVIKRVAQIIKSNKLKSNKVSFLWFDRTEKEERGLFPELGYTNVESDNFRRKVKPRIIKIVKGTLEILKEGNAITDFEEYREGDSKNPALPIRGYKIFYNLAETVLPTNKTKKSKN